MSLTDNAWPVVIVFGIAGAVCLQQWSQRQTKNWVIAAVVLFGLGAGAWAVERLIVTPGEELQAQTLQLVRDFQAQRRAEVMDAIDPKATRLRDRADWGLKTVTVRDFRMTGMQVNLSNDDRTAECRFHVSAEVELRSAGNVGRHPSYFSSTWKRDADRWRMTDIIELNPINGRPHDQPHVP